MWKKLLAHALVESAKDGSIKPGKNQVILWAWEGNSDRCPGGSLLPTTEKELKRWIKDNSNYTHHKNPYYFYGENRYYDIYPEDIVIILQTFGLNDITYKIVSGKALGNIGRGELISIPLYTFSY